VAAYAMPETASVTVSAHAARMAKRRAFKVEPPSSLGERPVPADATSRDAVCLPRA
jgi:hypothetical protein